MSQSTLIACEKDPTISAQKRSHLWRGDEIFEFVAAVEDWTWSCGKSLLAVTVDSCWLAQGDAALWLQRTIGPHLGGEMFLCDKS